MSDDEAFSPVDDHSRRQAAILSEVLEQFPALLTVAELVRAVATGRLRDQDPEAWEHAITGLCQYGLLRRTDDVVEPTVAAILANDLQEIRA